MKAIHYLFVTFITLAVVFYLVLSGYNFYINRVITYDSYNLIQFSDGVRYDEETKTIYTNGKIARWSVKRAYNAFINSGDKEFWIDNNREGKKDYKCVLVKNIVYDKK